nr:imelysin family protein [Vibrio mangrovi]
MKRIILYLAVLGITACQSTTEKQAQLPEQSNHDSQYVYAIEFHAARDFARNARQLAADIHGYCRQHQSLDEVRASWLEAMHVWQSLQGQARGPAQALEQSWNIQFWPDKKNTTGLKMQGLLQQDRTWTVAEIAEQSVAVQGVGAIEWLLYDRHSPFLNGQMETGCRLAPAIGENFAQRASALFSAWQVNPWLSLDQSAWTSEYISLLSNQLKYTLSKLIRPMAKIGHPRPYFSESWRSGSSLSHLKANVEAMQALYLAQGKGLDYLLREREMSALADRMKIQFESILAAWPEQSGLFAFLQTKAGYRETLSLRNKLEQLSYLLHDEVSVGLGVAIGFNATDGD